MKDNYNLYNGEVSTSQQINNDPRIRVPKLKRKTAWKRFYKLFPHLKGMKIYRGRSKMFDDKCNLIDLPDSFIPLKKIK